jgi:succinate-acetate transporter protein
MSTIDERRAVASAGLSDHSADGVATRVFLQPVAAPSILGLFGFAGATFIVAANVAGWYGDHATTPLVPAPFAAVFGGIAQFMAGMWAYRARDAVATAMHGMWGSFWIAYGILNVLLATHVLTAPSPWYHDAAFGFWFFALAVITASGALAAAAESRGVFAVLATLAIGSALLAGGLIYGSHGVVTAAG